MTVLEIIDVARDLINEPLDSSRAFPDNSSGFWKDSTLINYLNIIQDEVQQNIVQVFEDYFLTQTSVDLVAGQKEYALPADFVKMRRVEDNRASTSRPVELMPITLNEKDNFVFPYNDSGTSYGRGYYIKGDYLVFDFEPANAANSGVTLYYTQRVGDISAATSVSEIPLEHHKALVWGVASMALTQQQSDNNVAELKYERYLQRMKLETENRVTQRSRTVKKKPNRPIRRRSV